MAFTAIARQNSSDGNCDESLLTKPSEENLKNVLIFNKKNVQ
jgi:hypothetical protein